MTRDEIDAVRAKVLPTWQTAAAIGRHANVPAQTAVAVLKQFATEWRLQGRMVRVDGHNIIRMYRQQPVIQVLGVAMPFEEDEDYE